MSTLWDQIKKDMKEGWQVVTEKTDELTQIGKIKFSIIGIKRKIEQHFTDLGGWTYHMIEKGNAAQVVSDSTVQSLVSRIRQLESDLNQKEVDLKNVGGESGSPAEEKADADDDNPDEAPTPHFINLAFNYHPHFLLH